MRYDIAIEMGSSNTVIYKTKVGIALVEPTLVLIDTARNSILAYGEEAVKKYEPINENLQLVSPIKCGVIVNNELAKSLLKYFLQKIDESKLFKGNFIWLLNSCLSPNDKNVFVNLAYSLGYKSVDILPTSIAALQELEVDYDNPRAHMIVNIGGGNTDIAVVFKGKVIQATTMEYGGEVLNQNIKNYLEEHFDIYVNNSDIEELKVNLNSLIPNNYLEFKINDSNSGELLTINTNEFRDTYISFFDKICTEIINLLKKCNGQILQDINKMGIYVCGGQASFVGLDKFLSKKLQLKVYICDEPIKTVILGLEKLFSEPKALNYLIEINK